MDACCPAEGSGRGQRGGLLCQAAARPFLVRMACRLRVWECHSKEAMALVTLPSCRAGGAWCSRAVRPRPPGPRNAVHSESCGHLVTLWRVGKEVLSKHSSVSAPSLRQVVLFLLTMTAHFAAFSDNKARCFVFVCGGCFFSVRSMTQLRNIPFISRFLGSCHQSSAQTLARRSGSLPV